MKKYVFIVVAVVLVCSCFCVSAFASDSDLEDSEGPIYISEPEVQKEVLRITASNSSGFHAVLLGLLGDYNPVVVTTPYQYPQGTGYQTRYQVDVEPDWSWLAGAFIFAIVIYSLFRIIGIVIGGIK